VNDQPSPLLRLKYIFTNACIIVCHKDASTSTHYTYISRPLTSSALSSSGYELQVLCPAMRPLVPKYFWVWISV